jgi:hypothetical protein
VLVEAVQVRLIWVALVAFAVRLLGAVGGCVAGTGEDPKLPPPQEAKRTEKLTTTKN